MDHLVVRIVFLLACVCIDVMQTGACVTTLECVWVSPSVCAHTGCLLSGVRAKRRLLSVILTPHTQWHAGACALAEPFDRDQRVLTRTPVNLAKYRLIWMTGPQRVQKGLSSILPFWLRFCFELDCHLCLEKSIIAQSVSLYCTVPWYIPLQLKHRRTFQDF